MGSALAADGASGREPAVGLVTLAALENAVRETSEAAGPAHARTIAALGLLENRLRQAGSYTDAEIAFQRIVTAEWSLLPENHRTLAPLMAYLVTQSVGTKRTAARRVAAGLGSAFGQDSSALRAAMAHFSAVRLAREGVLARIAHPDAATAPRSKIAGASATQPASTETESGLYHIQFAALRNPSHTEHLKILDDIARAHSDLLGTIPMKTLPVDFGRDRGILHRLMAGPMTEARGRALCRRLAERDQDCFLVQP